MADTVAESLYRQMTSPGTTTLGVEGATLASSASVSLAIDHYLHAVSGTAEQLLIDLPYTGFAGTIALRPTGNFTTNTTGVKTGLSKAIGLASTAVTGKVLFMTYSPAADLWYPSY